MEFICSFNSKRGAESRKTLSQCRIGERICVVKITGRGALRKRLLEMGLTKGAEVCVKKTAPLGDPLEITLRGYRLSLRKSEAENIIVVKG